MSEYESKNDLIKMLNCVKKTYHLLERHESLSADIIIGLNLKMSELNLKLGNLTEALTNSKNIL
jgi:hypothetical protein